MDSTPKSAAGTSRSLPPLTTEQTRPYKSIQLDDIRESSVSTTRARHNPNRAVLQHKDSLTLLSRYKRDARTISTIKASYAASTSIERSDNHRAMIHHKDSLTLRERYKQGRTALQKTSAGSEFVFMWDALDKLRKVIVGSLDRRAKKNAKARRATQLALPQLEPFKDRPLPSIPTPIYDAHRKYPGKPAPKEFYLAWAATKDHPHNQISPPLPTTTRKPAPEIALRSVPKHPVSVTEPPRALRRSHHITLDNIETPRTVSRSKGSRLTRFSDFMRPRIQSNILTSSDKQSRLCNVCGITSSATTGASLSKEGLWLCGGCQSSDGSSGELPPLSSKLIQQQRMQPVKASLAWNLPPGKDLMWNCEHCFASFSSAPPAGGNLCICPICKKEIAAHPIAVSRTASKVSKSSKVSSRPSSLSSRGNVKSHFSQATVASEVASAVGDDNVSRPSVYRPPFYEDVLVPTRDSPVSPIGKGKFDNIHNGSIHPALRPLPDTPGLSRAPSKKWPDTEWRNSMSTPIPGIDKAHSYQNGPVTHLAYEFPSNSVVPSAATTAMDLSLPLTPQVPEAISAVAYFKSKTEQRKEVQYEKLRGIKHMASSIYPENEEERVYTDDKPLPEMPKHDVRRESFYPMSPELSESEQLPRAPALTTADVESGIWPVNASTETLPVDRRSSFYGFVSRPTCSR